MPVSPVNVEPVASRLNEDRRAGKSGPAVPWSVTKRKALWALALYALIFVVVLWAPPRWDAKSGLASLIDKHARLVAASPNVVLVGGSNVSTGINSEELEKQLHRRVVNMGLAASLGLRYMLCELEDYIRPGDVYVLMPEYDHFCLTNPSESNAQLNGSADLIHLYQAYPGSLPWIQRVYLSSPARIFDLLDHGHRFMAAKAKFYQRALDKARSTGSLEPLLHPCFADSPYVHRENYSAWGDYLGHLKLNPPGYGAVEILGYSDYVCNDEAYRAVENFAQLANWKGARVIILPPPMPQPLYEKYGARAKDIVRRWQALPGVQVAASVERYVFMPTDFFDTPYHLNAVGREKRTARIVEDLAPLVGSAPKD